MVGFRSLASHAKHRVLADLRSDPYLVAILLGAFAFSGLFFWQEIPNFATWDGRDRVLDPMVAYGRVIDDPSLGALREGVTWGREPFGSTFYLYGLAVLPVVISAAVVGDLDAFAELGLPTQEFGFWEVWHATPEWIWTWTLLIIRFMNVLFAVAAVYLTYRLGTQLRDRTAGRLAGTFLAVTWGMITLVHEAGEDLPSLVALLLALYLLVRYVQEGTHWYFFAASAVGAAAMTLKLTTALIVFVIPIAHAIRIRQDGRSIRSILDDRAFIAKGAGIGALVIVLGFPTLLVGGVVEFLSRVFGHPAYRVVVTKGPDAPIWWWFLRGYLTTLGLPLFLAGVAGVAAALVQFRRRLPDIDASAVVLSYLVLHVLLLGTWHDFRPHHLLPTLPLIVIFLAIGLTRLDERRPAIARPVVALLLLTTAAYAGVGAAQYGSMPRAEAVDWMNDNVDRNATMEMYTSGFEESAVPHWLDVQYIDGVDDHSTLDPCPEYVQLTYRDLLYLRNVPDEYRTWFTRTNTTERRVHTQRLLNGSYGYEIVAEFGDRPPNFVPDRPTPGSITEILRHGIYPHTNQYSDEQELRSNQYVAILRNDGACSRPLERPSG
jgi:hypothetical protein